MMMATRSLHNTIVEAVRAHGASRAVSAEPISKMAAHRGQAGGQSTDDFLTSLSDGGATAGLPALRENDAKQGAGAGFALELDPATVRLHRPAGDREPKAHAAVVSRTPSVDAVEPLEDALLIDCRNA